MDGANLNAYRLDRCEIGSPLLPELPLSSWEATRDTLHRWVQLVGQVKLAAVGGGHWRDAPLLVDVRGLTTGRVRHADRSFRIDLDFVDHRLVVRTSTQSADQDTGHNGVAAAELHDGLSVARFSLELHALLARLGVDAPVGQRPVGLADAVPFAQDTTHSSYDGVRVRQYWQALDWIDGVLGEFARWYRGRQATPGLHWHSLDLTASRFGAGRRTLPPDRAAAVVALTGPGTGQDGAFSFGFWPGDRNQRFPAFYASAAPEPDGLLAEPLTPGARWQPLPAASMALLSYDVVREAPSPRTALLAFLDSAYQAVVRTAGWDAVALASPSGPPPWAQGRLPTPGGPRASARYSRPSAGRQGR